MIFVPMWHIIWNGFPIITPTDNKIRGPSCCDYAFHKFDLGQKEKGDISVWKSAQYVDINFVEDYTDAANVEVQVDQSERLHAGRTRDKTWSLLWRKGTFPSGFPKQRAWTVTSFLNDSWQIPRLPAVRFLFTSAQRWDNLAQDAVCLVNGEPRCSSNTLYFMKWTSGSEINRPPRRMRTTHAGPYQEPAANLWQAKPAPSLDTPLVFEIKVDACNPGKWSLYSRLTPV